MANNIFAKQPAEFTFGADFEIFWKRFESFVITVGCDKKAQFHLFKSFLDDRSFRRIESVTFTDDHKTQGVVDLSKAKTVISDALSKVPDVPYRVQLRYIEQGPTEDLTMFGDAVKL